MTEFLHLVPLWQYVVHFTLLLKHTHLPFTQPDLQLQCETSVFLRLNFLQPITVLLWDHLPTQWFVLLHESTSEAGQFDIFLSKVHTRFLFCKTHVVLQPQLLVFFSNHLHLCHVVESLQSHHPQF